MLADSTNADQEGVTPSESTVGVMLDDVFSKAEGRVLLATFASTLILPLDFAVLAGIFLSLAYERYLWLLLAIGGAAAVIAREFEAKSGDARSNP